MSYGEIRIFQFILKLFTRIIWPGDHSKKKLEKKIKEVFLVLLIFPEIPNFFFSKFYDSQSWNKLRIKIKKRRKRDPKRKTRMIPLLRLQTRLAQNASGNFVSA